MTQKNHPTTNHTLSQVKEQFKNWRRTRKNPWPIPAKLLKSAVSLTANYTVRQISEELIIDYDDLKQACTKTKKVRKKVPAPTFIELDIEQPAAAPECIVEMENIMIQITPHMRILLAVEPADFRKGIDGLAAVCRQVLKSDPFSGYMFVFRNKSATAIKILAFDGQGFWLCQKRLSRGKFNWWPKADGDRHSLLAADVDMEW